MSSALCPHGVRCSEDFAECPACHAQHVARAVADAAAGPGAGVAAMAAPDVERSLQFAASAEARFHLHDVPGALVLLDEARLANPGFASFRIQRARYLAVQFRLDEALAELAEGCRTAPEWALELARQDAEGALGDLAPMQAPLRALLADVFAGLRRGALESHAAASAAVQDALAAYRNDPVPPELGRVATLLADVAPGLGSASPAEWLAAPARMAPLAALAGRLLAERLAVQASAAQALAAADELLAQLDPQVLHGLTLRAATELDAVRTLVAELHHAMETQTLAGCERCRAAPALVRERLVAADRRRLAAVETARRAADARMAHLAAGHEARLDALESAFESGPGRLVGQIEDLKRIVDTTEPPRFSLLFTALGAVLGFAGARLWDARGFLQAWATICGVLLGLFFVLPWLAAIVRIETASRQRAHGEERLARARAQLHAARREESARFESDPEANAVRAELSELAREKTLRTGF